MTSVGVLLGAGSSIPGGFPGTAEITRGLLSRQWYRHSSGIFTTDAQPEPYQDRRALRQRTLQVACELSGAKTYEQLAHVIRGVHDRLTGEVESLSSEALDSSLRESVASVLTCPSVELEFAGLLLECADLIRFAVRELLLRVSNKDSSDHFDALAEVCLCDEFKVVGVATLCHDFHAEDILSARSVVLNDGFARLRDTNGNEIGVWTGRFGSGNEVPYLKLHGSIDWWKLKRSGGHPYFGYELYRMRGSPDDLSLEGVRFLRPDRIPGLLVGTFDKLSDYGSEPFLSLRYEFHRLLDRAQHLLVCGYSFGDKGINESLVEWYRAPERKLVVIDPAGFDQVQANARPSIRRLLAQLRRDQRLVFMKAGLQDVASQALREALLV